MAKIVKFPLPAPEKFGFKPVRKRRTAKKDRHGQLNLFAGGKVIKLSQLSSFEEGLVLDEAGDERALDAYRRAIHEGDCIGDAYCNLGIIESERGNHSKAIDCFTLCLKDQPRHFEAHYNLANVYAEVGNYPLAKIHYQMSIEVEPEFPNSHFNLGLTYALNKEIDQAISSLLKYKELDVDADKSQADELIDSLIRTK